MMEININLDRRAKKYDKPELFQVRVFDYGDNYHNDDSDIDSVLVKKVRAMSSRPRTLTEYYESSELYWEYMHKLYEKHGGKRFFKMKLRDGVIDDYVPPKPRPKSKAIRKMGKAGIHISERRHRNLNWGEIIQWAEENLTNHHKHELPEEVTVFDSKRAKKVVKEYYKDEPNRDERRQKKGIASEFDYMDEYFTMRRVDDERKAKKHKKAKKKKKLEGVRLITDLMRPDYEEKVQDTKDDITVSGGVLLSSEKAATLAVYRRLAEIGWNSYALMRKQGGFSKSQLKQFKRMTKKDKKKSKKRSQVIDSSIDMYIGDVLADNGYSDFDEFNADMLDCSYENIKAQYDNRGGRSVFERLFS